MAGPLQKAEASDIAVIIGGVIASTLVTLFVMPALYLIVGARADRQGDLGLADA